jgi:hypothetical protein
VLKITILPPNANKDVEKLVNPHLAGGNVK